MLSSPFLIDDTKPVPGVVVDGTDFQEDVLWFGDPHQLQGNGKKYIYFIIILFSLINYKPSLSIKWFTVNCLDDFNFLCNELKNHINIYMYNTKQ